MHQNTKNNFQVVYGIALVLAGIGVFYRIPQVMPDLAKFSQFANMLWVIQGCFYFMGIILIGGGIRKIYGHFKKMPNNGNGSGPQTE